MEKSEKIMLAARLLSTRTSYVKNATTDDGVYFDFNVSDDGETMDVFRAHNERDTFFWAEDVVDVCRTVGLSNYVHTTDVSFGKDNYGNDVRRSVIAMHVC